MCAGKYTRLSAAIAENRGALGIWLAQGTLTRPVGYPPKLTNFPARHEGGRQEREHGLTALVGAGIAGLQDAPFGTLR